MCMISLKLRWVSDYVGYARQSVTIKMWRFAYSDLTHTKGEHICADKGTRFAPGLGIGYAAF